MHVEVEVDMFWYMWSRRIGHRGEAQSTRHRCTAAAPARKTIAYCLMVHHSHRLQSPVRRILSPGRSHLQKAAASGKPLLLPRSHHLLLLRWITGHPTLPGMSTTAPLRYQLLTPLLAAARKMLALSRPPRHSLHSRCLPTHQPRQARLRALVLRRLCHPHRVLARPGSKETTARAAPVVASRPAVGTVVVGPMAPAAASGGFRWCAGSDGSATRRPRRRPSAATGCALAARGSTRAARGALYPCGWAVCGAGEALTRFSSPAWNKWRWNIVEISRTLRSCIMKIHSFVCAFTLLTPSTRQSLPLSAHTHLQLVKHLSFLAGFFFFFRHPSCRVFSMQAKPVVWVGAKNLIDMFSCVKGLNYYQWRT